MKLRIKVSPRSGERDQTFSHSFGGVSYTVGPEPVEVSDKVGDYFLSVFSALVEVVETAPTKPKRKRR